MSKKIALYPGSFNPFHEGHLNIYNKACKVFDEVYIGSYKHIRDFDPNGLIERHHDKVIYFNSTLPAFVDKLSRNGIEISAIVRGLRNGSDLQYEENMLYWYEDLGLKIPVVYFICDRGLSHISSSAIRELNKIKK